MAEAASIISAEEAIFVEVHSPEHVPDTHAPPAVFPIGARIAVCASPSGPPADHRSRREKHHHH